jgi:ABC-type sugar transport system substrate-binding protein
MPFLMRKTKAPLAGLLLLGLTTACELPPREGSGNAQTASVMPAGEVAVNPNEEYVMVTTAINMPMYVNHDQAAFKRWGEKMGVKVSVLGPAEWDVPAQIETIEQVIATRPAGLLINGTDPGIARAINKAVEAGIPTVVYDSDVPSSRRHAFLGTDWYQIGQMQGDEMARLTGGRGKVAYMGILGLTNMEEGFRGLLDVLKNTPASRWWASTTTRPAWKRPPALLPTCWRLTPTLPASAASTPTPAPALP